jgi:RNA polymerase sigma-70 factor, ECF subfamily
MADGPQVTRLLQRWSDGDESVADQLVPMVYQELYRLALSHMGRERSDHTLQPTALVHEAYLRLVGHDQPQWSSRCQFFGFAARHMRQILVDHARSRNAQKRGGNNMKQPVDEVINEVVVLPSRQTVDLLALDMALERMAAEDKDAADALVMRYFSGMTEEEIAAAFNVSVSTVRRKMRYAEAWLQRLLQ